VKPPRLTVRGRLVSTLTQEILGHPDTSAFLLESEYELCRRFQISRATVRLALADLENRGLIYRKHGKGTFAHGRSNRVHRDIGFLLKSPGAAEHRPIAEMVRGAQSAVAKLRSAIVLLSSAPESWDSDMACRLGGIIIDPQDVTEHDLQILRDRKINFLLAGDSALEGPRIDLGQRLAARTLTEQLLRLGHRRFAILCGYPPGFDAIKRRGVHEALAAAGIDPATVPEFSVDSEENSVVPMARRLLQSRPRPTAVLAFDDSLGVTLSFVASRMEDLHIPGDLSIVAFHDWPYLRYLESALTTVRFEFFQAGQAAAEALTQAALTGEPPADLIFEPAYRPGQTVGPAPAGSQAQDEPQPDHTLPTATARAVESSPTEQPSVL
jgi:DNA-binding LacI/PurR family transcriptional regulator